MHSRKCATCNAPDGALLADTLPPVPKPASRVQCALLGAEPFTCAGRPAARGQVLCAKNAIHKISRNLQVQQPRRSRCRSAAAGRACARAASAAPREGARSAPLRDVPRAQKRKSGGASIAQKNLDSRLLLNTCALARTHRLRGRVWVSHPSPRRTTAGSCSTPARLQTYSQG